MSNPDIISLSCKSCGASIQVPPGLDIFNCAYCGVALMIQRGEGYVNLKIVEEVSKSIQEMGSQTQNTIREGTYATQAELRRLQIKQEISSLQLQLSSVQSEIRNLERQKSSKKVKSQLKDLHLQEHSLLGQVQDLQVSLYPVSQEGKRAASSKSSKVPPIGYAGKDWSVAFGLCVLFGLFGIHRFYTGHLLIGLLYIVTFGFFGIGWAIDITMLALGSYRDSYGFTLKNRTSNKGIRLLITGLVYISALFLMTAINGDPTIAIPIALVLGAVAYTLSNYVLKNRGIQTVSTISSSTDQQ